MSRLSPMPRSRSKSSLISATTYHSFLDVELYEPNSPISRAAAATPPIGLAPAAAATVPVEVPVEEEKEKENEFESERMSRQDSGYESLPSSSRSSKRRASVTTTPSTTAAPAPRPRTRPSTRRSHRASLSVAHQAARTTAHQLYAARQHLSRQQHHHHHSVSYFHFPSPPEPADEDAGGMAVIQHPAYRSVHTFPHHYLHSPEPNIGLDVLHRRTEHQVSTFAAPPQTTHYWTSDRTRRLEYAAIDAASRGARGWFMRHLVPDCFIPKEKRHVGFEDDRGSVRRYRLDLDEDEAPAEKQTRLFRQWRFWRSTKTD